MAWASTLVCFSNKHSKNPCAHVPCQNLRWCTKYFANKFTCPSHRHPTNFSKSNLSFERFKEERWLPELNKCKQGERGGGGSKFGEFCDNVIIESSLRYILGLAHFGKKVLSSTGKELQRIFLFKPKLKTKLLKIDYEVKYLWII